MEVALVEDDNQEAEIFIKFVKRYGAENSLALDVTHFRNAEDFLKACKQSCFSVVFMDIDLPGMGGLDAARNLRMQDDCAVLVFVTKMASRQRGALPRGQKRARARQQRFLPIARG